MSRQQDDHPETARACQEAMAALVLDRAARAHPHIEHCARCSADAGAARRLTSHLAAYQVAAPAAGQIERTLAAAASLLAGRAAEARARRQTLGRAVAVALATLPLLVVLDAMVLRGLHAFLSSRLPPLFSGYLIASMASFLALLLALACAAVPLLAARVTVRLLPPEEVHV